MFDSGEEGICKPYETLTSPILERITSYTNASTVVNFIRLDGPTVK
jgi:hypothetical protein